MSAGWEFIKGYRFIASWRMLDKALNLGNLYGFSNRNRTEKANSGRRV